MKILLSVIALVLLPGLAAAQCSSDRQAMSCAEGTSFDPETGTCIPVTTS